MEKTNGLTNRSPQMEQSPPVIDGIACRQSSHTGSLEMFIRGVPHRRQSEGNSVANKAAAMPLAQETSGLSCATTPVPMARIGVPLLLKTILLHPAATTGAPTGRIFFSIAAREAGRNEHEGTYHLVHISRQREAYSKTSGCAKLASTCIAQSVAERIPCAAWVLGALVSRSGAKLGTLERVRR